MLPESNITSDSQYQYIEGYQYEGFVYKYHEFRFRANVSTGPGLMIMIGTRFWSSIYTLQILAGKYF